MTRKYYTDTTLEKDGNKNINALRHGENNLRFKYGNKKFKCYCLEMIKIDFNSEDIRA